MTTVKMGTQMFAKDRIITLSALLGSFFFLVLFVSFNPFSKTIRKAFEKEKNAQLEWQIKPSFIEGKSAIKTVWIMTDKGCSHHRIESPLTRVELEGNEQHPHLVEYLDQMRFWSKGPESFEKSEFVFPNLLQEEPLDSANAARHQFISHEQSNTQKSPLIHFLRSSQGILNYEFQTLRATSSFLSIYESKNSLFTTKPSPEQLLMSGAAEGLEINLDSSPPKISIKGFKAYIKKPEGKI